MPYGQMINHIRCEEVNWRTSWKWALPVFNLEIEAVRRAAAGGSAQGYNAEEPYEVLDIWRKKETYLRRLLVSVKLVNRPEILLALVLHLIEVKEHQRALDDLELYLISYPYILSASLHSYAGMLCFYLSQPTTTREFSRNLFDKDNDSSLSRETSSEMDDDTDDAVNSYKARSRPITAEDLQMDERMLRNASNHFTKALDTETDAQGLEQPQQEDDGYLRPLRIEDAFGRKGSKHGTAKVAQTFLDKIDSLLREHASDEEDDYDAPYRNLKPNIQTGDPEESVENDDAGDPVPIQLKEEQQHPTNSPPGTPSTVAGLMSEDDDVAQEAVPTRMHFTKDSRRNKRSQSPRDDLSDGSGSVYSEMSIG
ncbi:hypothetical protein QFC21_004513 [Naganishia friedmannii]|uniref:Uncharacterized protein n=1 Tax=Naganishia friedmannii TaxID=89922 RepID=A0ACC2VFJ8_9TREE|nr:hypothetical protein QFC21_004513 [Naganishia friedmannii]